MTLLYLDLRCGACGRAPRKRIHPREVTRYEGEDPRLFTETLQCRCGSLLRVTAGAYQGASEDPPPPLVPDT